MKEGQKHFIENWLSKTIDSAAAPVFQQILARGISSINGEQKSVLVQFISALLARRPEIVRQLRDETPRALRENMNRPIEGEDPVGVAELAAMGLTLEAWVEKHMPALIENSGQLMLGELIADSAMGQKLFDMQWFTVDYSGGALFPFPTTDRPTIALGKGIDDPDALHVLPLAPHLILYGSSDARCAQLKALSKAELGLRTMRQVIAKARGCAFGTAATNRNLLDRYLPEKIWRG